LKKTSKYEICKFYFSQKSRLKRHITSVHEAKIVSFVITFVLKRVT
jgi:hypothetical protein